MKRKKHKSKQYKSQSAFFAQSLKTGRCGRATRVTESVDLSESVVVYLVFKEEVEAGDIGRLVHDLRPEADNPIFTSGIGNTYFGVHGYDEDPRDLLLIPEFRAFVRKVERSEPCWLYYAAPESAWLRIILAASSPTCVISGHGGDSIRFGLSNGEIARFLERQIRQYDELCKQAGIDPDEAEAHLNESIMHSFPQFPVKDADN